MSTVIRMELRVVLSVADMVGEVNPVEHPDMGFTPMLPDELEITYTKTPGPMRPHWGIQVNLKGPWQTRSDRASKVHATVGWTSHCQTAIPKWVLDKVYGLVPPWFQASVAGMFTTEETEMLEAEL